MIQGSAPHLAQTDWNKVDASTDPAAFVAYLDRLEASPMVQRSRQEFLGGLPCRPGERVLDAGCGVGGNTRQLRTLVGATGRVLGLDASRQMLQRAGGLSTAQRIAYGAGDLCYLPLATGSFDGAICDRVLMHLPHPLTAVRELVRVLRPGGWLGLCEPDWSRMRMEPDGEISQRVLETHCAGFEQGDIGGRLKDLVEEAGCQQVASTAQYHAMQNYEKSWSLMNLERTLRRAVETGTLSQGEVNQWRRQLEEAARGGRFCMHFARTLCIGWKEQE